ncbi:hypothetical protein D918_05674 [Trichuris suis]|nr:hypothetical protein D918_05674 [Trichuris suis]
MQDTISQFVIDKRVRTKYMTTINVNKLIVDYD